MKTAAVKVFSGMNLRDALTAARELGVPVEQMHRTGEWKVWDEARQRQLRVCAHRKDASRDFVVVLRRAKERAALEGAAR